MSGITRTIVPTVVHGGNIYKLTGGTATLVTGGSGKLSSSARVQSVAAFGKMYFVDGSNYVKYDPATNTASTWVATAGSLPNNGGNKARLISLYRGRIVLSGVSGDDTNWFMSKLGDPDDWDYAPATPTVIDAVAGNNADAGEPADIITSLISFSDDEMLFGCDHSLYRLSGDPQEAGRLDAISEVIGCAWGRAFTQDPAGNIYFMGMTGGIFRMSPRGGFPERISGDKIDDRLRDLNMEDVVVRMEWDDFQQGCMVMIHRLDGAASENLFFDQRKAAWWVDSFANSNHRGICMHTFDGDAPDDRRILIGGRDGHVYQVDPDADDDAGEDILSHTLLGPLKGKGGVEIVVTEVQVTMATGSDDVSLHLYAGASAEEAYAKAVAATPDWSETMEAGRNASSRPMVRGFYVYVQIKATTGTHWAFENAQVKYRELANSTVFS